MEPVNTNEILHVPYVQKKEVAQTLPLQRHHYIPKDEFSCRPFDYYVDSIRNGESGRQFWDRVSLNIRYNRNFHADAILYDDGTFAFSDDAPDHDAINEAVRKEEVGRLQVLKYVRGPKAIMQVFSSDISKLKAIGEYLHRNMTRQDIPVVFSQWVVSSNAPKRVFSGKLYEFTATPHLSQAA